MKALWKIAPVVVAVGMFAAAGPMTLPAVAMPMVMQGPPPGPGGWEAPPREFREIERRGFHDGVEGARKDFGNHRRPDVHNRDEYRNPPVHGADRRAYRRAFERGYQAGVEHIYNGR
jgi:ribosome modulation factor